MDQLRKQTGRHPDDPEQRMELWLAVKAKQALGAREGDVLASLFEPFARNIAKCVDYRTDSSTPPLTRLVSCPTPS